MASEVNIESITQFLHRFYLVEVQRWPYPVSKFSSRASPYMLITGNCYWSSEALHSYLLGCLMKHNSSSNILRVFKAFFELCQKERRLLSIWSLYPCNQAQSFQSTPTSSTFAGCNAHLFRTLWLVKRVYLFIWNTGREWVINYKEL